MFCFRGFLIRSKIRERRYASQKLKFYFSHCSKLWRYALQFQCVWHRLWLNLFCYIWHAQKLLLIAFYHQKPLNKFSKSVEEDPRPLNTVVIALSYQHQNIISSICQAILIIWMPQEWTFVLQAKLIFFMIVFDPTVMATMVQTINFLYGGID